MYYKNTKDRMEKYMQTVRGFIQGELDSKSLEEITEKYVNSGVVLYILNTENNEVYMAYLTKGEMNVKTQCVLNTNFKEIFYILKEKIQEKYSINLPLENIVNAISRNNILNLGGSSINLKEEYETVREMYFNEYKDRYLYEIRKYAIDIPNEVKFQLIY